MAYIGSCPDMCPVSERRTRVGHSISIFERDQNNQPNEYAMVKEYRRSGADQEEPSSDDLRTIEALKRTLDHLICNIMDDPRSKTQELALEWYDFLWDRLRAIRKDITQQNICDQTSAILVERCARFHVHSCYAMNRVKDFDVNMNKRNLNDCLQMLRQMYHDLKTSSGTICADEFEFQKYDILLHLNEDHLSSTVLMKYSDYRSSEGMRFITKVFNAYTNNDYYKFFQLLQQADYMTSCVLSLYANEMRLTGLNTIISACATRQAVLYPTELAVKTLGFDDDEDLTQFATMLGISTQVKDNRLHIVLSKDILPMLSSSGLKLPAFKSRCLVEDKMQGCSVGQLVYGQCEQMEIEEIYEEAQRFNQHLLNGFERSITEEEVEEELEQEEEESEDEEVVEEEQEGEIEVEEEEDEEQEDAEEEEQEEVEEEVELEEEVEVEEEVEAEDDVEAEDEVEAEEEVDAEEELEAEEMVEADEAEQADEEKEDVDEEPLDLNEKAEEVGTASDVEHEYPDQREYQEQQGQLKDYHQQQDDHQQQEDYQQQQLHKQQIADIMPAGHFKVRSLSTAQPTLRLPPTIPGTEVECKKIKRPTTVNSPQRKLDSIRMSIENEKEANKILIQLTQMYTQ